jgi:DNA mismatch endonuclease, patch repair protein
MTDVLTIDQRRLNMSRIRGRDTSPEMKIRRGLHGLGFRFRLHEKTLPGKPDLVLPKYRIVVFVHGCFWHGHGCALSKMPQTRRQFWHEKLTGNATRDRKTEEVLIKNGWRVLLIWECALRGRDRTSENVLEEAANFIRRGEARLFEIAS